MHITRKRLWQITLGAVVATVVIRLVTVFAIQDIYSCVPNGCDAQLHQADVSVAIGVFLQYVTSAIGVAAFLLAAYLWLVKKDRFGK